MTRMWVIDPSLMCRNHLLGEHKEIHQLVGWLRAGKSIAGWAETNCIEPRSIVSRHDALVKEMVKRGYNHNSPIPAQAFIDAMLEHYPEKHANVKIDVNDSFNDLMDRCNECENRYLERV